jgi:hypothetical protein
MKEINPDETVRLLQHALLNRDYRTADIFDELLTSWLDRGGTPPKIKSLLIATDAPASTKVKAHILLNRLKYMAELPNDDTLKRVSDAMQRIIKCVTRISAGVWTQGTGELATALEHIAENLERETEKAIPSEPAKEPTDDSH